jgi:ABC-type spermidine/putrescine transport system permease subunit II
MWEGVSFEIDPTISAASTLLVILSIAVVLTVDVTSRRMRGRKTAELRTTS